MKQRLKKIYNSIIFKNVTIGISAVLFVISLNCYFNSATFARQSIFNIIIFILTLYLFNSNKNISFKDKKVPIIFGLVMALILVIGSVVYKYNDIDIIFTNKIELLKLIIEFLSFYKIISEVSYILFKKLQKLDLKKSNIWNIYNSNKFFIVLWIIIFLSWIPTFLAYYPGILAYDSTTQTDIVVNGFSAYTQHHPPIHTLIWDICLALGGGQGTKPLVIYSLLQMLALSYVFAKLIKFLTDRKINNWIILVSILFVTINPIISIFSLEMTKDVYFTVFFILSIMEIIKLIENPKSYVKSKKNWIKYISFVLLASLFRNNAIYVFILFLPCIILFLKKQKKQTIILLLAPIIAYMLIIKCLYPFLEISKNNSQEKLCIPMQQLIYISKKNEGKIDYYLQSQIKEYFNYDVALSEYNPRFADPVKNNFNTGLFDSNPINFYKLWIKMFFQYPKDYISAFLALNIPYWYPDANTYDEYSNKEYIETTIKFCDGYQIERYSKLPKLLPYLENFANYNYIKDIPLVVNIFSISTPFWLLLVTIFVLIYKKHYKQILMIMPMMLLWLTYIAGPVSNFRYIFTLFALYPLIISLIFNSSKFKN